MSDAPIAGHKELLERARMFLTNRHMLGILSGNTNEIVSDLVNALTSTQTRLEMALEGGAQALQEVTERLGAVEAERDAWRRRAETAEATNKAWETHMAKANAAYEAQERKWAAAIAIADSENPTVRALMERLEVVEAERDRLEELLRSATGRDLEAAVIGQIEAHP